MNASLPSTLKILTILSVLLVLQGCSTFRSCESILKTDNYASSPHYKAVAGYYDRETLRPPAQLTEVENECWFDTEGNSQEEATSIVLSGCEESLRQRNKFDEWSCILIAEGDQLTEFEQQRIDEWRRISGRTKREDSVMVSGTQGSGTYDPDRGN